MKLVLSIAAVTFVAGTILGITVSQVIAAQTQIRPVKLTQLLKTDLTGCEGKEVTV
jgi:hypothetical protein